MLPAPPPFSGGERVTATIALPTEPRRLSPLSPVVRIGRAAFAFAYIAVTALARRGPADYGIDIALLVVTVAAGVISWAVTTWAVEGSTLHVATGLVRRRVVRVPLARVQAVDLVEPWLARVFGLAEVRVRTGGGGGGDARLQYLKVDEAQAVRTALVALVHGLPGSTPEAEERRVVRVDNGLLALSSLFIGRTLLALVAVIGEGLLAAFHLAVAAGSFVVYVAAMVWSLVRRVANEWGLTVSESPDGLRLRAGVGSRVRETIPPNRIQALHLVEPLFWRMFGWQRLELHLAGSVAHRRNQPRGVVRRALLPVGRSGEAEALVSHLLGYSRPALRRPPPRGRVRAPFSYHFLAAGHDGTVAVSFAGRVCRRAEMMPLSKVQSIHFVQGPLLRVLGLATVRVHAAGRFATVSWRQWDAAEARQLVGELTVACAAARAAALRPRQRAGLAVSSEMAAGAPSDEREPVAKTGTLGAQ